MVHFTNSSRQADVVALVVHFANSPLQADVVALVVILLTLPVKIRYLCDGSFN